MNKPLSIYSFKIYRTIAFFTRCINEDVITLRKADRD